VRKYPKRKPNQKLKTAKEYLLQMIKPIMMRSKDIVYVKNF
jgi:hypothetical protein